MPHCIIEFSNCVFKQNLNGLHQETDNNVSSINNLLSQLVFEACESSQLFDAEDIKTRLCAYEFYQVGKSDDKKGFIHVTLKILSGRTVAQKNNLVQLVLECLKKLNFENVSISAEVVDIDKAVYKKYIT